MTLTAGTEPLPLAAFPVFVREGAILPCAERMQWTDEKPVAPLLLHLYPGRAASAFTLYEDDGDSRAHALGRAARTAYTLSPGPEGATLHGCAAAGSFPVRVAPARLHRVDRGVDGVTLDGRPLHRASVAEVRAHRSVRRPYSLGTRWISRRWSPSTTPPRSSSL